jgi:hypothetical protein
LGGSKGIGVGVGVGEGEGGVLGVDGRVRFMICEGRRISSMPCFMGTCKVATSSSSSSTSEKDWFGSVSGVLVSFSRAKRMGDASRARWAEASSR